MRLPPWWLIGLTIMISSKWPATLRLLILQSLSSSPGTGRRRCKADFRLDRRQEREADDGRSERNFSGLRPASGSLDRSPRATLRAARAARGAARAARGQGA